MVTGTTLQRSAVSSQPIVKETRYVEHTIGDTHKLINGDTLDRDILAPESVDLIITSPPYNVGMDYDSSDDSIAYDEYLEFTHAWLRNCYHWSKPNGRICINVAMDTSKHGKTPPLCRCDQRGYKRLVGSIIPP